MLWPFELYRGRYMCCNTTCISLFSLVSCSLSPCPAPDWQLHHGNARHLVQTTPLSPRRNTPTPVFITKALLYTLSTPAYHFSAPSNFTLDRPPKLDILLSLNQTLYFTGLPNYTHLGLQDVSGLSQLVPLSLWLLQPSSQSRDLILGNHQSILLNNIPNLQW